MQQQFGRIVRAPDAKPEQFLSEAVDVLQSLHRRSDLLTRRELVNLLQEYLNSKADLTFDNETC